MTLLQLILTLIVPLAAFGSEVTIVKCDKLLLSAHEKAARKIVAKGGFPEDRTLQEYEDHLPHEFRRTFRGAKFWIDSGGGLGRAAKEARFWNPGIRSINITKTKEAVTGELDGHENLVGRGVEEYARKEFQSADLITDIFGAFSYSERPDMVLQRFNEWLAPDGAAYLYFAENGEVHVGNRRMSLTRWLLNRSGLRCAIVESAIRCQKVPGAQVPRLELIELKEDLPPHRVFREIDQNDLKPNIERAILADDGREVGFFEAHLSRDGEVLHEVFFSMREKRNGHSSRVVADLLRTYPKINEIHASLILDNLAAFQELKHKGKSDAEAFQETPFAKVFAKHGFHRAQLSNIAHDGVDVVLHKGSGLNP